MPLQGPSQSWSVRPAALLVVLGITGARLFAQPAVDAQLHADKAVQFAQRGDLKSAEAELRKAVELSPSDSNLLTSLGGILGMQGKLQEANTYLARAVKLNPQDSASRRNLAANDWQLGHLKEAEENLDLLLRANPQDKLATYLSGMVLEKEKAYGQSVKLLESVLDVVAQQPDGWVALADAYYHTGHADSAKAALRHLATPSVNPRAVFLGGRVAADAEDYRTAESLFRSVRFTYPDRSELELQLGLAEYQAGHEAEAEKTLLEAVNANQATSEAYILLATMLSDKNSNADALQVAERAARVFPDSSEVLFLKGSIEIKLHYFNDAVTSYERAAQLKDSGGTRRGLGTAQWKAGLRDRAIATFEEAMRRFPNDARTYQVYGTLLLEDASPENKGRAVELLERAIVLNDAVVEPRYQLAKLDLEAGNAQHALAYLEKAVRLAPKDSRLHYSLSRAYRRLNREADAQKETAIYQKLKAAEHPGKNDDSSEGTQP